MGFAAMAGRMHQAGIKTLSCETVTFVDLNRYVGVWYEIARYQIAFRRVVWKQATYALQMTVRFCFK